MSDPSTTQVVGQQSQNTRLSPNAFRGYADEGDVQGKKPAILTGSALLQLQAILISGTVVLLTLTVLYGLAWPDLQDGASSSRKETMRTRAENAAVAARALSSR